MAFLDVDYGDYIGDNMKLTLEDIKKYGTEDEKTFLEDWRKKFDPSEITKLKVNKLHLKNTKKRKKEVKEIKDW